MISFIIYYYIGNNLAKEVILSRLNGLLCPCSHLPKLVVVQ
uniref:Uncharacterized protein n=1 Tax=Arundo donax TaxID=35708 RepID=A0A0A9FXR9_ARUDO